MHISGSDRARATIGYLRRRIISGEWPVGSRIPTEPELMNTLGVGRTTVREAVRSLATMGMLETAPSRGTFVRSRLPSTSVLAEFVADFPIDDVLGFRRALEVEAARLAAIHRTPRQLETLRRARARAGAGEGGARDPPPPPPGPPPRPGHPSMVAASANPLIESLYRGAMTGLRLAIERGEVVFGASAQVRHDDHRRILAAIEEQDEDAATEAAGEHADRDLLRHSPDEESSSSGTTSGLPETGSVRIRHGSP